ncbi:MAG: AAA family ATPase [Colwellia sp.]
MYLKHFGLSKAPFQIAPDDRLLYLSLKHTKALVYMDYAVRQPDGFVVITGEIGAGKSTLIKRLMRKINEKVVCFHLPFTNLKGNELLGYIARQANIHVSADDKIAIIYALTGYFEEITSNGVPCVLVIDEAQNLSASNLEDIRMLIGLEGPNGAMLRVVMLGQPEFMDTMNASEQLRQRVKLHYHLMGLDLKEVKLYIDFRLEQCGLDGNTLFSDDLVTSIYKISNGIPRLINKVCDALLICAFSDNRSRPIISDFEEVAKDVLMLPNEHVTGSGNSDAVIDEGLAKSLQRIALALESISHNLDKTLGDSGNKKERKFMGLIAAK